MSDANNTTGTPDNFGDITIQPTGSGVADEQIAFAQAAIAEEEETAQKSVDAGIADETAGYDVAAANQAGQGYPDTIDEGESKSTSDGSGTSETD